MNDSLLAGLLALLLVLSVAALVAAILALRRTSQRARRLSRRSPSTVPADVEGLRAEVQALRLETAEAMRHLAVVRYDAFGDMGGHLSWSVALLDDGGNGILLTSIHGRSEARTYAKSIASWSCEQPMSSEEEEALTLARAG
ncbi:MAG: hypothetical protein QOF53_1692 [Nocardioidaceae bacterium]|jgi:hypothetical protein|nr:hypothetical protein [Nocardioidaceae bacterium]